LAHINGPGHDDEACIESIDNALRELHADTGIVFAKGSAVRCRYDLLVVEDQLIIAADYKNRLEDFGFAVTKAFAGEEAVEIVRNRKIDLILMDIDLGKGINGIQAAEIIRETHRIPIIFLACQNISEYRGAIEKIENSCLVTDKYIKQRFATDIRDSIIRQFFDAYLDRHYNRLK
ncbi:MAG: response regulator, partial [Spirochaetales bacterium]|nr:response regulator [Spirochaetales bacterium]